MGMSFFATCSGTHYYLSWSLRFTFNTRKISIRTTVHQFSCAGIQLTQLQKIYEKDHSYLKVSVQQSEFLALGRCPHLQQRIVSVLKNVLGDAGAAGLTSISNTIFLHKFRLFTGISCQSFFTLVFSMSS